ncbi:sulfur carrier protein ThiS [Cellulomonas sp. NS3]|uniref:sulfur carrier protein ThiS n=1 Tax=Cellulomonas sp. NS3 TaxID=2973977 RepID=UPI002161AD2C|nr:sulfur carrier protein ThiS [Cellulomonas sp. NS3]
MTSTGTVPTVTLNGVERPLTDPTSVAALVTELLADGATATASPATARADGDAAPTGVAVAVDDAIVPRGLWASTLVRAGARVEVVTAVQGG